MKRSNFFLCVILITFAVVNVQAANIPVSPGLDNLQNAINGAADGDVLLLDDGTYDNSTTVTVNKSITVRAASKAATPVILDAVLVGGASEVDVVLKGLEFRAKVDTEQGGGTKTGTLVIVECRFVDAEVRELSGGRPNKLFVIGNEFVSSVDLLNMIIEADELSYFAGNTITMAAGRRLEIDTPVTGQGQLYMVGNDFTGTLYRNNEFIRTVMEGAQIIGNRFDVRLDITFGTTTAQIPAILEIVGAGKNRVMNNLFVLSDGSQIADAGTNVPSVNALNVIGSAAGTEIRNNVFDFGGFTFDASIDVNEEGVIDLDQPGMIEGNIFFNTTRANASIFGSGEPGSTFAFNLCHMTTDPCGTADGNQDADPLFVDTMDYQLGGGSPGVNAGPDAAFFVDLDGTRADVGLYGGPFPIDQYDAQRNDTSTAPFIYPVFNASRSVNVLGDLPINVIGVARIR